MVTGEAPCVEGRLMILKVKREFLTRLVNWRTDNIISCENKQLWCASPASSCAFIKSNIRRTRSLELQSNTHFSFFFVSQLGSGFRFKPFLPLLTFTRIDRNCKGKFKSDNLDSMFETGCTLAHIPSDLEVRRDHQVIHQAAGEVLGKLGIRSDN